MRGIGGIDLSGEVDVEPDVDSSQRNIPVPGGFGTSLSEYARFERFGDMWGTTGKQVG
jgi:hypothetical protein